MKGEGEWSETGWCHMMRQRTNRKRDNTKKEEIIKYSFQWKWQRVIARTRQVGSKQGTWMRVLTAKRRDETRNGKVSEWERGKHSEGDRSLPSFLIVGKHGSADSSAPSKKCNCSELLRLCLQRRNLSATVKRGENKIWQNINLFRWLSLKRVIVSGSSRRSNSRDLNSLLSICHSGIAVSVFTAKLFISCVLIESLTSGHVILVLHWFHVCGSNVIWKRKYCSCT